MSSTTVPLAAAITMFVAVHVGLTYCASERLNVFTALCMLSLLPALALGALAAAITLFAQVDGPLALPVGASVFSLLVLPYTGQAIWELTARRRMALRTPSAGSKPGPSATRRFDVDELIEE